MMKKHTKIGKIFFWFGFLFFISGMAFNQTIGVIKDGPEALSSFSMPSIISGLILIIVSNFFKRKD